MSPQAAQKRKDNTVYRYKLIRNKFSELYSLRVEGMRPNYDDVIGRVSETFGISICTVKRALKTQ